jgi:threonine/homoserine/homoserine lactone efflux protein
MINLIFTLNYELLFTFATATAALAISPGPDNIYVLTQSIANGRKYGLATVAGLISGCLVHTTFLAFGVSALLQVNERLYFIIKVFGALYLFYLAWQVFRTDSTLVLSEGSVPKKSEGELFRQGFIMNVLNPKVTIFFLAFFPGFLFSDSLGRVAQFYILGFLFMLVSAIIFSLIAILSGYISERLKKNTHIGAYLKWLQIIVFIAIAVYLFISD